MSEICKQDYQFGTFRAPAADGLSGVADLPLIHGGPLMHCLHELCGPTAMLHAAHQGPQKKKPRDIVMTFPRRHHAPAPGGLATVMNKISVLALASNALAGFAHCLASGFLPAFLASAGPCNAPNRGLVDTISYIDSFAVLRRALVRLLLGSSLALRKVLTTLYDNLD